MIQLPFRLLFNFFGHFTHTNYEVKNLKNKKKNGDDILIEISASFPVSDPSDTTTEMVNTYGTYEIQDTADTENQYPAIAQGYNAKIVKRDCENRHNVGKRQDRRKTDR